jgi:hypothetical protein
MRLHLLAAAALVSVATPALAQGIDSKHSPEVVLPAIAVAHDLTALAYRYSGQHAGGPADALAR